MISIISGSNLEVLAVSKTAVERLEDINSRLQIVEDQLYDTLQGEDYLEAQDVQKLFNQREVITDV